MASNTNGKWNHQRWGTLDDPIHKSQLSSITGNFGCLRAFRYSMQETERPERETVSGKACIGNASHETIARALNNPEMREALLAGRPVATGPVRDVFQQEMVRAGGGRELTWGPKDSPDKVVEDAVWMTVALLNDLHNHVAEVVEVEAGFIAPLGDYWTAGHVDLVYRPRSAPDTIAFCDWKTGQQRPDPIDLEHGFESGLYANALHDGIFLSRELVQIEQVVDEDGCVGGWKATGPYGVEITGSSRFRVERAGMEAVLVAMGRELVDTGGEVSVGRRFHEFPSSMHVVHMRDYLPYTRKQKKRVDRPEEMEFFGLTEPGEVTCEKGDGRGPAWWQMRRTARDVVRLEHLVRNVVGVVRMGRFFESVGEKCKRCAFRAPCLTAGYAPKGEEKKQIEGALKGLDLDELGDVA